MQIEAKPRRVLAGRIGKGADLLDALHAVCREANVRLGRVEAVGAVERARVGYYDQKARAYVFQDVPHACEIVSLLGNVSIKDGEAFVHAHVALAPAGGRTVGGHLAAGTVVFACEYMIQELEGPPLARAHDEATGLPLWDSGRSGRGAG